jgi:asparagine synthase (glutamine-hydrolysing)
MCGISGFNFNDKNQILKMIHSLNHRGPDGFNFFLGTNVSLGHNRLSIIDLSKMASQPMKYKDRGNELVIIFNGEIYNYLEIRSELISLGYSFLTESDTEVILASYSMWGEQCVNKFNGMWAFCIFDIENQKLFISRDRLGVKPLYYFFKNGNFIFSSEIKGILCHSNFAINTLQNLDTDSVRLYFTLGYIPAPKSIFKNVYKLEAGNNLVFDLNENKIVANYSFHEVVLQKKDPNISSLMEEGRFLLNDSIKLRMRSDVPVGAFLSGGLDSSSVVGEMKHFTSLSNLHTFSVGFDDPLLDETYYINLVKDSFKTNHHHYTFEKGDFDKILPFYQNMFDEPFSDYSSFPAFKVSELAKQYVKVVLSGDGGDEIFGGYPIYSIGSLVDKFNKLPDFLLKNLVRILDTVEHFDIRLEKVNEVLKMSLRDKNEFHSEMFNLIRYKPRIFKDWSKGKLGEALDVSENNLSEALRVYDLKGNTLSDNYLVKVDRTSMFNSIEVRSPFLDYRFIDFAQRLPANQKVTPFRNKIMMRELIKPIVPEVIVKRKKMGFTPPVKSFLMTCLGDGMVDRYLNYLSQIDSELYLFYNNLIITSKDYNSSQKDYYLIKLLVFGGWLDFWIFSKQEL